LIGGVSTKAFELRIRTRKHIVKKDNKTTTLEESHVNVPLRKK